MPLSLQISAVLAGMAESISFMIGSLSSSGTSGGARSLLLLHKRKALLRHAYAR